jgi:hypothetical protein
MERQDGILVWPVKEDKRARAEDLDGAYFLKSSRQDMEPEET